jgi:hypothetical protein
MMTGPLAGMFSMPRQSRRDITIISGLTSAAAPRFQNPSLRRATVLLPVGYTLWAPRRPSCLPGRVARTRALEARKALVGISGERISATTGRRGAKMAR